MSSTLDQMAIVASQIKEATVRGENTANRVGGLLVDIVDYLSILRVDEVELGPFLTALKNSQLLDPHDGQTLTFSILEDKWTFSSAITQLKLSQKGIEEAVASNYQVLQQTKELLQGELDQVEADLNGKYDNLTTWRVQTDAYIAQYATAYDEEGNLVSMSRILQTTEEITQTVEKLESELIDLADYDAWEQGNTQNEQSGIPYDDTKVDDPKCLRMKGMLPVTKNSYVTFVPDNNNYSICLLYFNKDGVYSTSTQWSRGWVNLDSDDAKEGRLKITDDSDVQFVAIKLKRKDGANITVENDIKETSLAIVNNKVATYSEIKQTADSIMSVVSNNKKAADEAFKNIDEVVIPGLEGEISDVDDKATSSATWISQNKDRILLVAAQFDEEGNLINTSGLVVKDDFSDLFATEVDEQGIAHTADLKVYVEHDEDGNIVTGIKLKADQIDMNSDQLNIWADTYNLKASNIKFSGETYTIEASKISYTADDYNLIAQNVTISSDNITFKATTDYSVIASNITLSSDNITFKATTDYSVIASNITLSSDNISFKATTDYSVIASNITLSSDNITFEATTNYDVIAEHIKLMAEQIDFITDGWQIKNTSDMVTLQLDTNGNLTIAGDFNGGKISKDVTVGTKGQKIYMYVDENDGTLIRSGLRGTDPTYGRMFDLGFEKSGSNTYPTLYMSYGNASSATSMPSTYLTPGRLQLRAASSGNVFRFGVDSNGKLDFYAQAWLDTNTATSGQVYRDTNGYLRVK